MNLCDNEARQYRGRITHLQFLIDHLEEESLTNADYYINRATLDLLKEKGTGKDLARLIESIEGGNNDIEMAYERI